MVRLTPAWRESVWAYLFLAPAMLGLLALDIYPMISAFWMSLHDWPMIGRARPFIGLENYANTFQDALALKSFLNTVYYTVTSVPATMVLGLIFALILNLQFFRLRGFFRTTYYLPVITSWVAVSFVWLYIYEPSFGWMNELLRLIGLAEPLPKWLGSVTWAMPAIIIASIWKGMGGSMVLFLAGLQGIAQDYYEAAAIDGASPWQRFWQITLPLLNPTVTFVAVVSVIGSLQVFTPIVVMTSSQGQAGGPLDSTRVLVYHIYHIAFRERELGFAVAMAYVLFIIILALTLVQLRLVQRNVEH